MSTIKLLDALDKDNNLPKTVLYCLNPKDNDYRYNDLKLQGGAIKENTI